jgi:hypothetical protein
VIQFACGRQHQFSVSYQATDWALERSIVGGLKLTPETGVVIVDNARLEKGARVIASAFLERIITDPNPFLFSTGTGDGVRRRNDLVVAVSTNFGQISEDLMNRALPIHLSPVGNVADRESPIGNPKLEYIPANRERFEAEGRGMILRWMREGQPLDTSVRHPFTSCTQTIGGILMVNGFEGFLGNYSVRRTADDPVRNALALMAAERPDEYLRAGELARVVVDLSLVKVLIPEADRHSDKGRERAIGAVLSKHLDETFDVPTTDGGRRSLCLKCDRRRFEPGKEAHWRYIFKTPQSESGREDQPEAGCAAPPHEPGEPEGPVA